jgi:protoporphyrinogen/coproporphyrinogen III oxidase
LIVIIGGGITGLAAAYELTCRGQPFVLLESSARAGGLILTERVSGFTIDGGPDSLLAQKPAAIQLCSELGLAGQLISTTVPRTAFVLKKGRLYALPSPSVLGIPTSVTGLAGYDLLGRMARARMALEPLVPRSRREDESVGSFFRRRLGRQSADLIAGPLLGGIHAGDIDRLSMHSLFPRLVEAEHRPGKVLRNLRRVHVPAEGGVFRALRNGMGDLVTAILARLPPGAARFGAPVHSLRRLPASWQAAAGDATFDSTAVILAVPAHVAGSLLEGIEPGAAEICARVPYASTVSVALGFRRDQIAHPLSGSGFVVARRHSDFRITACTWSSSKWEARAPEGHALVRAFVGGTHDPAAVEESDDDLIAIVRREISRILRIGGGASPVVARVHRWRRSAAQHTVGHRARMTALEERLRHLPGLFAAGSGFRAVGIPDCVADGRQVAAAAADYVRIKGSTG